MANYSFTTGRPLPTVENGHEFIMDNFAQVEPTSVFSDKAGLIFRKCNLTNCIVPADSVIDNCLHNQRSFCANLHTDWVEKGHLQAEVENCPHVTSIDEIWVDGVLVDTIYHYVDGVL